MLHSLSIAAVFGFEPGMEIIDLGTGGGFPGIPLAIYFPDVKFHLVDSIGKKLKVVDAVASNLGLNNVTTQHTRAEEIKSRKFDFVISRAVAPLKDLWKWSKPLLQKRSKTLPLSAPDHRLTTTDSRLSTIDSGLSTPAPGLICLKGGDLAAEIQESHLRPYVTDIHDVFGEEYFHEKYILFCPL